MFPFVLLDINWGAVGLQAGQLILALSILVILHEFGHFLPAKIFGCRVEKFFLFFDPWFSLVKKKIGDTVYGIGWLPLGGYVKISGMIDESMDKEQMKQPAESWEFRSKPAWQRLIIMIGGVTVNVLLAFVIYAMTLFVWGETKLPNKNLTHGVWVVDTVVHQIGLKTGDKILAVNDKPVNYFDDMNAAMLLGDHMTIDRDGQQKNLVIPVNFIEKVVEKGKRSILLLPRVPCVVGEVGKGTPAEANGLLAKDQIIGIDSHKIEFYDQLKPAIQDRAGDSIQLLGFYVTQFKKIVNPSTGAYKGVGGFKSMGSIFPKYGWDWEAFWNITAFLSIALAFMNLLPIPALDGGHVMFTLYEMITGKKPSDKFMEYAQIVGMVLLFGLMIYANANDWLGWGK